MLASRPKTAIDKLRDKKKANELRLKRSTVLGHSKYVKQKNQKEFDIRLSDPAMAQKWGLKITDSSKAWIKHKALGSRKIVVAIIDTGIDINHPDLKNNLWVNEKEKNGKPGVDDDGDGFIDDIYGWNFVGNNNNLTDNHGHGTHIAGIIGAEGGNGVGVSGVAPLVSLMALKYYDPKSPGQNNLQNTLKALKYAIDKNVDIINYSGGGLEPSPAEKRLIQEAQKKGILLVAAAGNESSDSDVKGYYPADYKLDNIISVTAIDKSKSVLSSSNWGNHSVDIAAPGNNIYSTLPEGQYGYLTGTSQATAFVTGVAVLLKARFHDFDAKRIIKHITETGDLVPGLNGKTRYSKVLNTYRALAILDQNVGVTGVIATNINGAQRSFASDQKASSSLDPNIDTTDLDNQVHQISDLLRAIQTQK